MIRRPPRSTPFPYTTLSRSSGRRDEHSKTDLSESAHCLPLEPHLCRLRNHAAQPRTLRLRERLCRALAHRGRSEEHTSELQSQSNLVCRLLLEKTNTLLHVD